jgi:hypothetical protein
MPISVNNGESGLSVRGKMNGGFGIESGAMESPYELTFNIYHRIRTLTVSSDIEIGLASSGMTSNTFETLVTTGNGSNALTFDADIELLGETWNNQKVQTIDFRYIAGAVIGVITTISDVSFPPTLSSATMNGAEGGTQTLDLVFNESVTITTAGWTVSATGGAVTVSSVSSGSGTTAPKLSLSRSIGSDETLTVSYDPGTGATVSVDDSTELATVTAQAVTNNAYEILFNVPFTGTTVDTGAGTVTNPDSANLTIAQNGTLRFTRTTDTLVSSSNSNYWRSVNTYGRGAYSVLMNKDIGFTFSVAIFIYRVDANNDISIIHRLSADSLDIRIRSNNVTTYTLATGISTSSRVKIVFATNGDISFYYWSGSAWTQMGTTRPSSEHATLAAAGNGNIQLGAASSVSDGTGDRFSFDDVYITDKNYTTVTP